MEVRAAAAVLGVASEATGLQSRKWATSDAPLLAAVYSVSQRAFWVLLGAPRRVSVGIQLAVYAELERIARTYADARRRRVELVGQFAVDVAADPDAVAKPLWDAMPAALRADVRVWARTRPPPRAGAPAPDAALDRALPPDAPPTGDSPEDMLELFVARPGDFWERWCTETAARRRALRTRLLDAADAAGMAFTRRYLDYELLAHCDMPQLHAGASAAARLLDRGEHAVFHAGAHHDARRLRAAVDDLPREHAALRFLGGRAQHDADAAAQAVQLSVSEHVREAFRATGAPHPSAADRVADFAEDHPRELAAWLRGACSEAPAGLAAIAADERSVAMFLVDPALRPDSYDEDDLDIVPEEGGLRDLVRAVLDDRAADPRAPPLSTQLHVGASR